MDTFELLKILSAHTAVTGYEKEMSGVVSGLLEKYCDSVETDRFYNVIGYRKGCGSGNIKSIVTAHYDEIGLIVKSIDDRGFLRISNAGGIDAKILLAQEVIVHGREQIPGVIGARPPHLLKPEEAKNAVKLEDLVIDTGIRGEKLKELVSIGDVVSLKAVTSQLQSGKVSMKAADNRCGVAALIVAAEKLSQLRHEMDVYFVATTQEEFELSGATTAAYKLRPQLAVVLDAGHGDMTDVPKDETFVLGKGPSIGMGPNFHKKLVKASMDTAKEENIPYQAEAVPGSSGTEAWAIQVSREGIPTVLMSIPVRYMHTPVEVVHQSDIRNTGKLTARLLAKSDSEMEEILCC